jgi:hypothetical protein
VLIAAGLAIVTGSEPAAAFAALARGLSHGAPDLVRGPFPWTTS